MSWDIVLYASDNPDDPDNVSANEGEFTFKALKLFGKDEEAGDRNYKADGSKDRDRIVRPILDIELLPFYVETANIDVQQSIDDLAILEKMLNQPYLVIKSCTLPPYSSGSGNYNSRYPLPAEVRFRDISYSEDKEAGEIGISFEVEFVYTRGKTQPTPVTTANAYTY